MWVLQFISNNNLLILINLDSWKFPNEAHFDSFQEDFITFQIDLHWYDFPAVSGAKLIYSWWRSSLLQGTKTQEMGCTERAPSWRCLRWCPRGREGLAGREVMQLFPSRPGALLLCTHPVKEGVVGCNPDMPWSWHSRIHSTHLSFYFGRLRVTDWESVYFSTLRPFRTVRSWTLQWSCHSFNTSNMC